MTASDFSGRVTWLGHAAFLIESGEGEGKGKGARIAIDPFIGNNPKFPKGFDYERLDVVAATHGHHDHFGEDGMSLAKKSGATVVCIFELALFCRSKGLERVSAMNKGGAQTLAGVEIRMVHADHSSGTSGAGGDQNPPGDPCGYVLTMPDGFRELYRPDLALLPIGDLFTMGPREAAKACELLRVPRVIPMHWGTFPVLTGTPKALRDEIGKRVGKTEVIELAPGESWPPA